LNVIAAIERDDIAGGTDRNAAHAAQNIVSGIMEKIFHQMEWQSGIGVAPPGATRLAVGPPSPPCAFIGATAQSEIAAAQTADIKKRFFIKASSGVCNGCNLRHG
jgi:hypothetical protein